MTKDPWHLRLCASYENTGRGRRYSTGSVSDLNLGEYPFIEAQVAHAPRTVPLPCQIPIRRPFACPLWMNQVNGKPQACMRTSRRAASAGSACRRGALARSGRGLSAVAPYLNFAGNWLTIPSASMSAICNICICTSS